MISHYLCQDVASLAIPLLLNFSAIAPFKLAKNALPPSFFPDDTKACVFSPIPSATHLFNLCDLSSFSLSRLSYSLFILHLHNLPPSNLINHTLESDVLHANDNGLRNGAKWLRG